MITLKIPYICNTPDFQSTLKELRTLQSSYTRSAYQLFKTGLKQFDVQRDETLQSKFQLGSWLKQSGLMEAKAIHERNKDSKVIFGGKGNFFKRLSGKITQEEWKNKRLGSLYSIGEASKAGNRLYKLQLESSSIVFKPAKKQYFKLELPKLHANWKQKLELLQAQTDLNDCPYTVRLDEKFIYLTFEEVKVAKPQTIETRFLGIDLNPECIGLSIIENSKNGIKILHTQEYSVKQIITEMKSLKVASTDSKLKSLHNKLNFETIEIAKDIEKIALHWRVKGIFIEDLSFKGTADKGKRFNRLTKNLWKRDTFIQNLEKRCKVSGISFYKVNPMYSSIIGNLMYNYTDPINASIEIARRGAQVIFEKNKKLRKFYPNYMISLLKDQWKEHFRDCLEWKEVFNKLKNLGLKYRVSAADINVGKVFKLNSLKSRIVYITI